MSDPHEKLILPGPGCHQIAVERVRQVSVEGWSPEHDDEHDRGELARAAACYASLAASLLDGWPFEGEKETPEDWPWDAAGWKPSPDPARNLEKAGALIAAELDRLHRKRARESDNE